MKKFMFTLFAVALAFSASANQNVRAVQAAKAQPVKAQKFEKSFVAPMNVKGERVSLRNSVAPKAFGDPVDTFYIPPVGTFYSAPFTLLEDDVYWHTYPYYIVPAGPELTWRNSSLNLKGKRPSGPFYWTYIDKNTADDDYDVFEGENLNTTYAGSVQYIYQSPYLQIGEDAETVYQFREGTAAMFRGGTLTFEIEDAGDDNLAVDFRPFWHSTMTNTYATSKGDDVNARWSGELNEDHYYSDADSLTINAIAEYIPYTGHACTISRVKFPVYVIAKAGAQINAKIVVRDADGNMFIDRPVAEAVYEFDEDTEGVDDPEGSAMWTDLDFVFQSIDEHGLLSEEPVVIDNDAFIVIDGAYTDDRVQAFHPIMNCYQYPYIHGGYEYDDNSVVILTEYDANGEPSGICSAPANAGYYWGAEGSGLEAYVLPCHFFMQFDLAYPFLEPEVTEVEADVAGETLTVTVNANEEFDSWGSTTDLPDWITVDGESEYDEEDDIFTGNVTLSIEVAALPAGTSGRTFDLAYEIPGANFVIKVKQGEAAGGILGDCNGDGVVDVKDVTAIISYILGDTPEGFVKENANVSGDPTGDIDVQDVTALINLILA